MSLKFPISLVGKRGGAAAAALPEPLHWFDLDSLRGAGDGIMDKGTGNWGRLVNNGNVAVIADHPDGVSDALDFPGGAGDYLDNTASQAWDGVGNDFTCSCWVHVDVMEGFFMMDWGATGGLMFRLRITLDDPEFSITDDAQTTTLTAIQFTANATPINAWYHIVCTYDSATDTAEVFVDGVSQVTTTDAAFTTLESSAQPFTIGSQAGGTNPINAKLFQAAIWDTVLDSDQISTLFSSGTGGTYSDLITTQIGTNPTSTNLHAWWKLENTDDADGGTYNLTNNNSVTFTSGYNDNAATYNGSNSLSVADDTNFPTGDQTWACFIKLDNFTGGAVIMSKDDVSTNRSVLLYVNPSGNMQCYTSANGTALASVVAVSPVAALSTGVWYHIALVIDTAGTDMLLYIDGVLNNTQTTGVSSVYNGTAACYVGGRSDGIEPTGQIDDAVIFDKALSADEVRWLVHNSYADL